MAFNDTPRNPTIEYLLKKSFEWGQRRLHTALPGKVESYDASTQKADIKPLIMDSFVDNDGVRKTREFPIVPDVPVMFPRSGDYFISFPVKEGDNVLLLFLERSIDKWIAGDKNIDTDPEFTHMHSLTDAVCLPGFYQFRDALSDAHTDNIVIGVDGGLQTHHKANEIAIGEENPSDAVALASIVLAELQKIQLAFDTHFHQAQGPTSPTSVPLTPIVSIADPASQYIKAKGNG